MKPLKPKSSKSQHRVVFKTPWLQIIKKHIQVNGTPQSFYVVGGSPRIVAILAMDQKNNVYLIRQNRPAVNQYITSLPGGGVNNHETPLQAAKRELREELGLQGGQWKQMFTMYQDPGRSLTKKWVFFATRLRHIKSTPDQAEQITQKIVPIETLIKNILQGKYNEPTLIAAALWYYLKHGKTKHR